MSTAVLFSSGLDSAVLAAAEAQHADVYPLYVSSGLAWEGQELAASERLLACAAYRRLHPLVRLSFTVEDLYPPSHWAIRGVPPAFDTADEDVYLIGRNIVLLSKAAIHCARHGIARIAMGTLSGNPFPDATTEFLTSMATALSAGLAHEITIATPFAHLHKRDVIRLGQQIGVPLDLTLSCMNPRNGLHCGQCSKCRERRDGFREAGIEDATRYAQRPPR